jgi:hypothetical protein
MQRSSGDVKLIPYVLAAAFCLSLMMLTFVSIHNRSDTMDTYADAILNDCGQHFKQSAEWTDCVADFVKRNPR